MQLQPFMPMGQAFIINTNATPSTSQVTPILTGNIGLGTTLGGGTPMQPNMIRLFNAGSAVIWLNWNNTGANVAIPTAGTTTVGTPQYAVFVEPGVDLIFTMNITYNVGAGGSQANFGFYISTICSVATQPLYVQLGEGA
jgi:hypothetical protein